MRASILLHCNKAGPVRRQADIGQPIRHQFVDLPTEENGRQIMYIGIGGLILLIILLVVLL